MAFPANKTKLVCTVGPASDSPAILQQMLLAAADAFSRHERGTAKLFPRRFSQSPRNHQKG
jgi:hypothetical protein